MGRYKNVPTAEEFNRKMHECVKYKKLIDQKESNQILELTEKENISENGK